MALFPAATTSSCYPEAYIYRLAATAKEPPGAPQLPVAEHSGDSHVGGHVGGDGDSEDGALREESLSPGASPEPLLGRSESPPSFDSAALAPRPPFSTTHPRSTAEFVAVVEEIRRAIASGRHPVRIRQGSSGSYFCKNTDGQIVAVFKPKDEEPYGQLNPKWTKWLHKTCLPCCFGRSCLIPNLGYISEAAASVVDRHLSLHVVPRTEIVSLAAPSFYYSYRDRTSGKPLPQKIGSLQLFMHGHMDAAKFLRDGPRFLPRDPDTGELPARMKAEFQDEFERMLVLDYIIRNTDRGLDNWMVRYVEPDVEEIEIAPPAASHNTEPPSPLAASETLPLVENVDLLDTGRKEASPPSSLSKDFLFVSNASLQIAAIDNGLAFPFKHPDQWRSYPYGWASLPAARVPFSRKTREKLLPVLTSKSWWDDLIRDLLLIFRADPDFDGKLFRRQLAVMKGQVYNLVQVLRMGATTSGDSASPAPLSPSSRGAGNETAGTPLDLVMMPPCLVWEDEDLGQLIHEDFSREVAGKNHMFGRIIGGLDRHPSPSPTPSSSQRNRNERGTTTTSRDPGIPNNTYHVVGDFLTSADMISNSAPVPSDSPTSTRSRFNRFAAVGADLSHGLDAFRGRVITFVKNQPWFTNW